MQSYIPSFLDVISSLPYFKDLKLTLADCCSWSLFWMNYSYLLIKPDFRALGSFSLTGLFA